MTIETIDQTKTTFPLTLTDSAVEKAADLLQREDAMDTHRLRVSVQPGGCSGLRYSLFYDERALDGDVDEIFQDSAGNQLGVVIDRMSVPYLQGATVDFVDTIEKQGFTIDNPQATGSCACGDSFH